ncbi:uncharacterized protein DDB_G0286591-like [Vanessa atalanta]|uniref:uncharacterized protein DDB_G0286591-like n=1 Tax=Vanessa atalanta TaxID=42275 RepID=UPI001FCE1720|nr:uncharacterized protein DDB_G0286591-like [Vanessa atalanta]
MKTFIVLCSLVTITIAVPSLPRKNFETVIEDVPERIIREKKSPLHDALQESAANDGKEILQNRNSQKTESLSLDKTKPGFRKPIIIKKKLGYHVYRDSDEEMAHADPTENCRKQFKVKLCDNEPSLDSQSTNVKTLSLERPHENISDKEMENSIKMARDAVEKLQKDLLKMEQNTGKLSNSKEHLESDMSLQQDIEMAKSALEHIQKNIGNIESIDFQLNDLKKEESQVPKSSDAEAIAEWKESVRNIYKNVEIPRNIEDAFKFDKQNVMKYENAMLDGQQKDQSSTQSMKAVNDDNNKNLNLKSKEEHNTNAEDDMFVSTTDHKESKMKLHSESLTSDNVFDKTLGGHDIKPLGFNTNDHFITAKHSESNFENEKTIHKPDEKVASGTDMSSWQNNDAKNLKPAVPVENNIFNTLTRNSDISSGMLTAKNTENSEGKTLKDSHVESSQDEHHKHKSTLKTNDDLNLAKSKSEGDLTEAKQSLSESSDVSETEQRNVDHIKPEFLDKDNMHSSGVKMTSIKSAEMKDPHSRNVLNINSSTQKNIDNPDKKLLDKADLTGTLTARAPLEQLDNVQESLPSIPVDHKAEHISNEFSRMRMDQLLNENHESQDFPLMHSNKEKEPKDQLLQASKSVSHLQNTQLSNMNTKEHLNEHNNLNDRRFMNFAEEKHFNENLPQHLKMFSESNNEYTINPSTKTNEFRNQHIMNEYMNARMHQIHNMEQLLRENHRLDDFPSMPSASRKQHIDHSSQQFKSEAEFHNDHLLPTFTKTNGLKNGQTELNRHQSMRVTENSNKGHELSDSQHLADPFMLRWAQEKQHKDLQEFKGSSEFNNGHKFPTMMKTNMFQTGQHKEPMHMRITEDSNLGQAFTDSHELHDSHLMHWAQEKQHNENLAQTFDGAAELHSEQHMSDHLHEHIPTNRFNDNFDLDSSHDIFPMRPRMHEHLHMMKHAKPYDMDNSMQPSMHISMRDSDIPLGHHHHHHHHGLARSSYSASLPIANSSPGAIGVFSEANTGCGIPLLLSCSPSVVSGSLAKAHPTGNSAPAYRAGDDLMYYMKRDANNIEGLNNVKVHKPLKTFKQ